MKTTVLAALLTLSVSTAFAAPAEYTISGMEVREISQTDNMGTMDAPVQSGIGAYDCSAAGVNALHPTDLAGDASDILNPINSVDMVVDKIINIGSKIWKIVVAGKPVFNEKVDVATALPMGARCWNDLHSWSLPESRLYEVSFKNGFGTNVIKFDYRILWLPGGQVDGVGRYIGYATMSPANVRVNWGFNLDATVTIPTVYNMGTKEAPRGGMLMTVQYRITTPFALTQEAQSFAFDGAGAFTKLK